MRQVKFKAWNTRTNQMEVIEDLYWFEENMVHKNGDNDFILLQYSGLIDSAKQDIFEGDIIRIVDDMDFDNWEKYPEEFCKPEETFHQVKWLGDLGFPGLDIVPPICEESHNLHSLVENLFEYYTYRFEVIGNIHQNPELLK